MGQRRQLRKVIQVPVRIFGTDSTGQVFSGNALTVNVSELGAELCGVEPLLKLDEIIGLTYGKNRVHFRVKWVGKPGTPQAGHVGLLNIAPEKPLWDFPLPDPAPDNFQSRLAERRQHTRFRCHNSVELHTQAGATFWATIADLSVGGCYVEMAIPLPPGTKVSVGIWIAETKAWADCEVAFSSPGFGIGLKFKRISETDLARVRQYLGGLKAVKQKPSYQ